MKKRASLFLVFLFFSLSASDIFACVCAGAVSAAAEFNHADAVFSARYIGAEYRFGIKKESAEISMQAFNEKQTYKVLVLKFAVEQQWKGESARTLELVADQIRLADGGTIISDCDFVFDENKKYLVYAWKNDDGRLQTGTCSRTARLKDAREDLRILGKSRKEF